MATYLEVVEGNSSKFWQIEVDGSKTIVKYGKIGSAGVTSEKDHGSAAKAEKFAEKQIGDKEKKGYSKKGSEKRKRDDNEEKEEEEKEEEEETPRKRGRGAAASRGRRGGGASGLARKPKKNEPDNEEYAVPVVWTTKCGVAPPNSKNWVSHMIFGIYVDALHVYGGNEEGVVAQFNKDGILQKQYKLPDGVKCIVGDGSFLYAGCNNGSLYDITQGVPRLMCKLEEFGQVFWMDVLQGVVAASDSTGKVALVNSEGETVWSKKSKGTTGWMCRIDESGIYHGHSSGITKYDMKGKQLWHTDTPGISFGVQDEKFVYGSSFNSMTKLDKKTGKIVLEFPTGGPSNGVSTDGKVIVSARPFTVYNAETGEAKGPAMIADLCLSMAFYNDELYAVGNDICRFDVSDDAVAKIKSKKWTQPNSIAQKGNVEEILPEESVSETTDTSGGILCECVKEGSKLRVRVISPGYNKDWNVQFPQAIRKNGARYVVEKIIESAQGGFYRAWGDIKQLKQ